MGIFLLFKKKETQQKSGLDKKILGLKNKRINCVYEDFEEFLQQMRLDLSRFVKLTPVNYYATKSQYIEAQTFYAEDFSECYVKFVAYKDDKSFGKSEVFEVSATDLVRFFAKVGIIVKLDEIKEREEENEG